MNPQETKKAKDLKTPQSLIHLDHTMTLVQYKYWVLFLHDVKRQILQGVEPDEKGYYYISMKEVNALMGLSATQRKSIIFDDLKALKNITVSYNVLEKDGTKAKIGHGLIYDWYVSNNRIGYILPKTFVDTMLQMDTDKKSIFHLLNWQIFNSFSGKYEAIIYKLCKDYIGVGITHKFTIDEFRKYLGLGENEYTEFKILNHWTIQKPIKIINESEISDITISVKFEKQGRKVVGVQFLVELKQKALPFNEKNPHIAFAGAKIPLSTEQQQAYLEKYNNEQIEAIIERANEYAQKLADDGKKVNFGAVYNKAFVEGWGLETLEAKKRAEAEAEAKRLEAKAKKEAEKKAKAEAEAKERAEKERIDKAIKIFEGLPADEQEKILDEIESLTPPFMKKYFSEKRKKGEKPYKTAPYNFGLRDLVEANYPQE